MTQRTSPKGISTVSIAAVVFTVYFLQLVGGGAAAMDSVVIRDDSGKAMFQLNYIDVGDRFLGNIETTKSEWYLDPNTPNYAPLRTGIENAAKAWADILGPMSQNTRPGIINIGGISIGPYADNDAADSMSLTLPYYHNGLSYPNHTALGALMSTGFDYLHYPYDADGKPIFNPDDTLAHGLFLAGTWPSFGGVGTYTDLPNTSLLINGNQVPTESVFVHEFGHAIGLGATCDRSKTYPALGVFPEELSSYTEHLVDARGAAAKSGLLIFESAQDAQDAVDQGVIDNLDQAFITGDDNHVFFQGDHLSDVLKGAMDNKAPINGFEQGKPEYSHIEFRNSMMSHQPFSNYGFFMEAELAIFQDLGLNFDRKRFYGLSIYDDGLTIDNTQGFFARNADGSGWLEGVHSQQDNAIGLHVYGSGNTIRQSGTILTAGLGSIGVRVDGADNRLTVGKNTRIETLGQYAHGVAVTYGSGHTLNHQGAIIANHDTGRAVSFDFGSNSMSDVNALHGSYMVKAGTYVGPGYEDDCATWQDVSKNTFYIPDFDIVDGALVDRFDLSGTLVGGDAAIHIGAAAHVAEINVLNGAAIVGDINSLWKPNFRTNGEKYSILNKAGSRFEEFTTDLTFGKAMDDAGNSLNTADADFYLKYAGDINGGGSVALSVVGGNLEYDGKAKVIAAHVQRGATLSGIGTVAIADTSMNLNGFADSYNNTFVNDGTILPGNTFAPGAMTISLENGASFVNNGTVSIGFDQNGNNSVLAISGAGGNTVDFNGVTEVRAMPDYYANGVRYSLDANDFFDVRNAAFTNNNTFTAASYSPTFDINVVDTGGGNLEVYATRAADAYAQFGNDDATRAAGRELQRISNLPDMPESFDTVLYGLDLAGLVGAEAVERGLNQLVPHFANSAAMRSLDNQRVITSALMNRLFPEYTNMVCDPCGDETQNNNGLRVFVTALGGGGRQSGNGYGLPGSSYWSAGALAGIERENNGVVLGAHIAMTHSKQRGSGDADNSKFKSNAFSFGLHGGAAPTNWNGGYLFGLVRGTVEENRLDRSVSLITGQSINNSKWTGFSGSAVLGGGYDFECGDFRFGPMAGLDYALSHRRSVSESGRFALLDLESGTYQSFRVMAGLRASGMVGEKTRLSATARWNHELLSKMGDTKAKFAGVGRETFATRAKYPGRDSLSASIAITHAINDCAEIGLEAGGEFFRKGHTSGWGSATFTWNF